MRPRDTTRIYQTASRAWLTLAGLSLLLPPQRRLGVWLPLHLAVAGAASVAIGGAMQNFALALTQGPGPSERIVWVQFALANAGAVLIALGKVEDVSGFVAAGGVCFVVAVGLLGSIVWRSRRRALNKRHAVPLGMYGGAIFFALAGGAFGALMGSGAVHDPDVYLGLRSAHMVFNVLGWISLTVASTMITLLPSVLRVRMLAWHGGLTAALLGAGVLGIAGGLAFAVPASAAIGAVAFAAGAVGVAWMALRVLRTPRRWPVAVSGMHLGLALVWFVSGSLALATALLHGEGSFAAFREVFLVVFVGGWICQALLGAWLYLLPMQRPGTPEERRRQLYATEFASWLHVVGLNAGLALMALRGAGWVSDRIGALGVGLAVGGGGLALIKAWAFAALARGPVSTDRARRVWGA